MNLKQTEVLLLDVQTTGATPAKGHLLEVAWCRFRAEAHSADCGPVASSLVALPRGARLPRQIRQMTGITRQDLVGAPSSEEIWSLLNAAVSRGPALAVIHFARFERKWLEALAEAVEGTTTLPMQIVCTHAIAERLLPTLPRRGIRALSGYFGHSVSRLKRAAHHVEATATIWRALAHQLEREADVVTVDDLSGWLAETSPGRSRTGSRQWPLPREERLALPRAPGVYRMQGLHGQVLYVGKASDLKRRVNSYFQKRRGHAERTMELLTSVHALDVTLTASPLEAALLESDEIKRLKPPFNVALQAVDRQPGAASVALEPWTLDALRECDGASVVGPRHGPLPSPCALEGVRLLHDLLPLAREQPPEVSVEAIAAILRVVPERAPTPTVFMQGVRLFGERHQLTAERPLSVLWRLGARRWWRLVAEREKARAERQANAALKEADAALETFNVEEDDSPSDDAEPREWTPGAVVFALEAAVSRGARLIRRGQWLCQLSNAAVVWSPRHLDASERRVVEIVDGVVVAQRALEPGLEPPAPSSAARRLSQRLACFDVATYDRLLVLTSELRRVLDEGRPVEVRTGPRGALDAARLAQRLRAF